MKTIQEKMLRFLEERKEDCKQQTELLQKDERADEARFYKAKSNIYDVFKSLFEVSYQQAAGDKKKLEELFLAKAAAVPASWKQALEQAKLHDDAEKVLMEETKLSAADEIVETFEGLMREEA